AATTDEPAEATPPAAPTATSQTNTETASVPTSTDSTPVEQPTVEQANTASSQKETPATTPAAENEQSEQPSATAQEAPAGTPAPQATNEKVRKTDTLTGKLTVDAPEHKSEFDATVDRQWNLQKASLTTTDNTITVDIPAGHAAVSTPKVAVEVSTNGNIVETGQQAVAKHVERGQAAIDKVTPQPVKDAQAAVAKAQQQVNDTVSQVREEAFDAAAGQAPASAQVTVEDTTVTGSYDADTSDSPEV
ncbi:hypothetical protein QKE19_10840, partial [Corynebacterium sp. c8Ua_99]